MEPTIDWNWLDLLKGTPAMHEIWVQAFKRIEEDQPLAPVQQQIVEEWLDRAIWKTQKLRRKSQRGMLSNRGYSELAALEVQIQKVKLHKGRHGG